MYKRHPNYNTVFETIHKKSGKVYIGTILLYNETSTNINYKPEWKLCLISKDDESLITRKFNWGTPMWNDIIDQWFEKPKPYSKLKVNDFIEKWIEIKGNENVA